MGCCASKHDALELVELKRNFSETKLGGISPDDPMPRRALPNVRQAIAIAEKKNGGPVFFVDVYRAWLKIAWSPIRNHAMVWGGLHTLYEDD
jgi:hypothetical protein